MNGTRVTVHKLMSPREYDAFAQKSAEALKSSLVFLMKPLSFSSHALAMCGVRTHELGCDFHLRV